jgi:hypothetical protein
LGAIQVFWAQLGRSEVCAQRVPHIHPRKIVPHANHVMRKYFARNGETIIPMLISSFYFTYHVIAIYSKKVKIQTQNKIKSKIKLNSKSKKQKFIISK